ncbi:MAG TPA: DUF1573 domain-containing protein [Pirellulales bacterium]
MRSTLVGYLLAIFLGVTIGIWIDDQFLQPGPQPAPQAQPAAPPLAGQQGPNAAAPAPAEPKVEHPVALAERQPAAAPPAESLPAESPTANAPPAGVAGGVPKLRVEAPRFDFGNLERGEKTEHAFVLQNEGTAPLEITKIHSDHPWIAADAATLSIPPGQKAELKLKLDLAGERGRVNGQIVMKTNDPATPNRHLMIVGTVNTKAKIDPPRVDFGDLNGNERASRTFKVTGERGLRFNIEKTRTSNDGLSADVKVVSPGNEYEVTATLDPTRLEGGKFRGWIHLLTDQRGEYHLIPIPVTAGYVVRPAEPAAGTERGVPQLKLVFPKFKLGDPVSEAKAKASHDFRIKNVGTAPLVIKSVRPNASWVTAEISTFSIAAGEQAEVTVSVDAAKQAGQTGEIVVESNDPAQPTVHVGVVPRPPAPDAADGEQRVGN